MFDYFKNKTYLTLIRSKLCKSEKEHFYSFIRGRNFQFKKSFLGCIIIVNDL